MTHGGPARYSARAVPRADGLFRDMRSRTRSALHNENKIRPGILVPEARSPGFAVLGAGHLDAQDLAVPVAELDNLCTSAPPPKRFILRPESAGRMWSLSRAADLAPMSSRL